MRQQTRELLIRDRDERGHDGGVDGKGEQPHDASLRVACDMVNPSRAETRVIPSYSSATGIPSQRVTRVLMR